MMLISRTLRTALLVSVGVHLAGMSAVTIIAPEGFGRMQPFTQVDFLGPILEKTAFDIMIEGADPVFSARYGDDVDEDMTSVYLKVETPKRDFPGPRFPGYFDIVPGRGILDFLSGTKTMPDILLSSHVSGPGSPGQVVSRRKAAFSRKVVHRPAQPLVMRGLYGNETGYFIKVRALADRQGKVKLVEPLTTTGYPGLDLEAAEYVKTWLFEPAGEGVQGEEWVEVELFLETGGGR